MNGLRGDYPLGVVVKTAVSYNSTNGSLIGNKFYSWTMSYLNNKFMNLSFDSFRKVRSKWVDKML